MPQYLHANRPLPIGTMKLSPEFEQVRILPRCGEYVLSNDEA
jgi:hypothetical protein